ncbi:MAG TPA: RHS repeat domain-containing protein [Lunatimonas sp.]|nr:RHS repeat domain-containing protein [Lunatimonas sp.]
MNSKKDNFIEWAEEIYDEVGRVVQLRDFSGNDMNLQYDASGQLPAILSNQGSINVSRNDEEAIDKITTSWGSYQPNSYDAKGSLKKIEMGQSGYKDEINFKEDRPYQLIQYDGGKWEFFYFNDKQNAMLKKIQAPNGLSTAYGYNKEGRLASVDLNDHHKMEYEYDDEGRLIGISLKPSP